MNSSTNPPDLGTDDSRRFAREAKEPVSDPAKEIVGLKVAVLAHEVLDTRRWRTAAWAFGLLVSGFLAYAAVAWAQHGDDSADRARLEDVQARIVRIEQQMDRLLERSRQ